MAHNFVQKSQANASRDPKKQKWKFYQQRNCWTTTKKKKKIQATANFKIDSVIS